MVDIARLHAALARVAPIVSLRQHGSGDDPVPWATVSTRDGERVSIDFGAGATAGQREAAAAAVAAYAEPAAPPPARLATGYALVAALTDAQYAAGARARDLARLQARGLDMVREDNPVVARIAAAAGLTPSAWFDAALAG